MKAVILAAGKGTRMRELTAAVPKPMLRLWDKPILEHIVTGLVQCGIREIFIVTGYCAETIESHFGDGARWGCRIVCGRQFTPNGTGKAPEVAREFVGADEFLVTYGDILVRPDTYQRMLERYASGKFSGLLAVTRGEDVAKGGIAVFDREFCLERLVEKPTEAQIEELRLAGLLKPGDPYWYNAGIYIFKPVVFEFTAQLQKSPRGEYELTDAIQSMRQQGHRLAGLEIAGRWVDVRDPEVLNALERDSG